MKSAKRPNKHSVPLSALIEDGQEIAYHVPGSSPENGDATINGDLCYHDRGIDQEAKLAALGVVPGSSMGMGIPPERQAGAGQAGKAEGKATGGRSAKVLPAAKVTAKPLSPIPPSSESPSSQKSISKSPENPISDMPVLPPFSQRSEDEGGGVVHSYPQVPFTPQIDPPFETEPVEVRSPFVTGNERIDRRTAFTQYCRLGEGRTYIKVSEIMNLSVDIIKKWANEDGWENAYRSQVTADITQIAKEENIHEYLDVKREIIAQLKAKIQEAKEGKEVFKTPKEMLDTMLRLEELTGAKGMDGNAKPGQIFVIIDKEEWEAREKLNEQARKEEAKA